MVHLALDPYGANIRFNQLSFYGQNYISTSFNPPFSHNSYSIIVRAPSLRLDREGLNFHFLVM